ncbi:MAG: Arc family DNA-binding protein [Rhodocyclaceae bacterium]|nr:Arc family DNA-binding protein [Rhodocyclaceae bacterium]
MDSQRIRFGADVGVNLSIKDVPDDLAQQLRERAARNHRSLQGELMAIIEQAMQSPSSMPTEPEPLAAKPHGEPCALKTIEQLMAERAAQPPLNFPPDLPRGVDIIRADRDIR